MYYKYQEIGPCIQGTTISPLIFFSFSERSGHSICLSSKLGEVSSRDLSMEVLSHGSSLGFPSSRLWERISDEDLLGNFKGCKIFQAKLLYLFFINV